MSAANNNYNARVTMKDGGLLGVSSIYLRLIYERRLIMFDSCIEFGLTIIILVVAVSIVVSINW